MHRRQWLGSSETGVATSRMHMHTKKVMLGVWWGVRGTIHWKLLPFGYKIKLISTECEYEKCSDENLGISCHMSCAFFLQKGISLKKILHQLIRVMNYLKYLLILILVGNTTVQPFDS